MNKRMTVLLIVLSFVLGLFSSIEVNAAFITTYNITPQETGDEFTEVEYLIGRYQFNYAGSSNGFQENGSIAPHIGAIYSGHSHVSECAPYEEGSYANSSGSYLDGSYNNGGSIYKAYLTIEYDPRNITDYLDYPITLLYGGESGTPTKGIKTKVQYVSTNMYPTNVLGWVDITDFIKESGYGWYYCCNIPFDTDTLGVGDDRSADWKIVVIEENKNIEPRMVSLSFGSKLTEGDNYATVSVKGEGITTKKYGAVTGQILYNISNIDGRGISSLQLSDNNGVTYKDLASVNAVRALGSPVSGLKTRNTEPIVQKANYTNSYYWDEGFSAVSTNPSKYMISDSDTELLDIDGTTSKHNITVANNSDGVHLRFHAGGCILVNNILGIAVDIGYPYYTTTQTATGHDKYYATITGTTINTSPRVIGIGLNNTKVKIKIDKGLKILSTTATFTDADGSQYALSEDMYTIDTINNTITYTMGKDSIGRSMEGSKLSYTVETMAIEADSVGNKKVTANNDVQVAGYLISNNIVTNFYMDKVAWDTSKVTIFNPPIVKESNLTVKPNGGVYNGTTNDTTSLKSYKSVTTLLTATRNGYTFDSWSKVSGDATLLDGKVTMGLNDTVIQASWVANTYKLTVNPNSGTWEGSTSSQEFSLKCDATKIIVNPTKTGYKFTGWTLTGSSSSLSGTTFTMGYQDATLTANWEPVTYEIKVYPNKPNSATDSINRKK